MLTDADYMDRALALAARRRGLTGPNPLVGAVVVTADGTVAGAGYHESAGKPHAEVRALAAAADRSRGATMYCNLEPCCHTGRTGPCVERIVEAGIRRVVASIQDPNPLVNGQGFRFLRDRGIVVESGLRHVASARLNAVFLTNVRRGRPHVIMKVASTLDGRIARRTGPSLRITSPEADRRAHRFRAEVDAIAVGSGTVLADDPLLTTRGVYRERRITRVVLDRRLRTPVSARLFSTLEDGPVIIMSTSEACEAAPERMRALQAAGARVFAEPRETGLLGMFTRIFEEGVTSVLLEGGPAVHSAAWEAGLVDQVHLYLAPFALGEGLTWMPDNFSVAGLHDLRVEPCGPDVFIEGYVHRAH